MSTVEPDRFDCQDHGPLAMAMGWIKMLHNVTCFLHIREKKKVHVPSYQKSLGQNDCHDISNTGKQNEVSAINLHSSGVGNVRDRGAREEETISMGLFGGNKAQCAVLSTPKVLVYTLFLNYRCCS